jgi:GcrA cell cycle regulator
MEWNDETIARLRTLWNEGMSTAEIGRRMGVSKNAVVGKAHRLGLVARPSPIRRDGTGSSTARPVPLRRIVGPTLPPLGGTAVPPSEEVRPERPQPRIAPKAPQPSPPVPPPAIATAVAPLASAPVRVVAAFRTSRLTACCWPLGEPGTKNFRFCDEEALTGKPYCGDHAQVAYVKVRDRREDAA